MFDNFMFYVYRYTIAYHSLRGSGMGIFLSLRNSFAVVFEDLSTQEGEPSNADVPDFQVKLWIAMKEIAEDSKK